MVNALILVAALSLITIISMNGLSVKFTSPLHLLKILKSSGESIAEFLSLEFTNCLRAIAILLILVSHISGTMNTVVFTPLGGTGVAIFLFISGYGLNESYKKKGLSHYWRNKIVRVLLPYFIIITLLYMFSMDFTWQRYILDILGLKTSFWYIAFLMKWYIAFWVFSRYLKHYRTWLLLIMGVVILFLFPNLEAEQGFSFLLGYIVSCRVEYFKSLSCRAYVKCGVLMFVVGTALLAVKQLPAIRTCEYEFVYNIIQAGIKLPYAVSVVCFLRAVPKVAESKFLVLTGMISYELYLVQMPFYADIDGTIIVVAAFIIACYIVAYAFNKLNVNIAKLIR